MSKAKKVAILITSLRGGGAERVASILCGAWAEKYVLHLVLMSSDRVYELPTDLNIHYLDNEKSGQNKLASLAKLPLLAWRYKRLMKRLEIDVSFSFMYRPNFINIISKRYFKGRYKVIASERSNPSKKHPVFKYLVKKLYPKANVLTPNSYGTEFQLKEYFGVSDNLRVIQNPINLQKIEAYSPLEKQEKFVFVTVGRLEPLKNHQLLLEAFAAMDNENCELWLLGDGKLKLSLEEKSKDLGIADKVIFQGFQAPFPYLKTADCFVFGSNYEGFPNVLVEAMSCGLPVISTDCPSGPRELLAPDTEVNFVLEKGVEEAKYGVLVPMNAVKNMKDAMKLLLENNEIRAMYSKLSVQRASEFEQSIIVQKYTEIIEE